MEPVECGGGVPAAAGADQLVVHLPAVADAGADLVSGTVDVTPEHGGVTTRYADVVIARDGRVVVEPMPKDLMGVAVEAGSTSEVTATASLRSCVDGEPLPPGDYEAYVVVRIVPDGGDPVDLVSGPHGLVLR